jgi:hypothetical protein
MRFFSMIADHFMRRVVRDNRGFWGALAAAVIPAIASQFLGKGDDKSVSLEPMVEDWQSRLGRELSDYASKYISQYKPGQDFAGLDKMSTPTGIESQGLTGLNKLLASDYSPLLGQAEGEVSKTLSGGYDPYNSDYYKAYREGSALEERDALKRFKGQASKYGYRKSNYEQRGLADIIERTGVARNQTMANLAENERVRRLTTGVQEAQNLAKLRETLPIQRTQAALNFGSLNRLLEGVKYNDFLRKQGELKAAGPDQGSSLLSKNFDYGSKTLDYKQPSALSDLLNPILGKVGEKGIDQLLGILFPTAKTA